MTDFSKIPFIAQHTELYKTDPEAAHMWDSSELGGPGPIPTLLLTTLGRKSGEPRSLPLIYGTHGNSYAVVGSKGGETKNPLWYLNLQARPNCELMVGAKAVSAIARTAVGKEREEIWAKMVEIYPVYLDYEKATDRVIPIIVLDPVETTGSTSNA